MALKANKKSGARTGKQTVAVQLDEALANSFSNYVKEQAEKNDCVLYVSDVVRHAIEEIMKKDLEITVE